MKLTYAGDYYPPAPVMNLRLALPEAAFSVGPVRGLVDTGADATLLPLRYVQALGVPRDDLKYARGPWGERRPVFTYLIDVEIAGVRLPGIEVIANEANDDDVVVGRNILNKLRLNLDGPAGELDVSA